MEKSVFGLLINWCFKISVKSKSTYSVLSCQALCHKQMFNPSEGTKININFLKINECRKWGNQRERFIHEKSTYCERIKEEWAELVLFCVQRQEETSFYGIFWFFVAVLIINICEKHHKNNFSNVPASGVDKDQITRGPSKLN